MTLLFVAVIAFKFLIIGQAGRISLVALPSRFPQNGSRLHLICQFHHEKKFNIMWKRNDFDVGEECLNYKKVNTSVHCFKNKTSIEWILTPVTYATRGKWSCSHGTETASVDIIVNGNVFINTRYLAGFALESQRTFEIAVTFFVCLVFSLSNFKPS